MFPYKYTPPEQTYANEPNLLEATYRGFDYTILRVNWSGHLCGYVHAPFHLTEDQLDRLSVHGGITYNEDGWLGFDCAHSGDYLPWKRTWSYSVPNETYRNLSYVEAECKRLIDQLSNLPHIKTELVYAALATELPSL